MSEKPEWFEMTEGDQKPEPIRTGASKRLIKIAAIAAPLVLVGGAMVFADGEEGDDRPNIDTTITSTNSGSTGGEFTASSNSQISGTAVAAQQIASKTANTVSNSTPAAPSAPSAQKGPGVPAPSANKGDDDEEREGDDHDEREGDDHEGSERSHHERGEHERRKGTAPVIPKPGTTTTKN